MTSADTPGGPSAPESPEQIAAAKADLRTRARAERAARSVHGVRSLLRQERAIAVARRCSVVAAYASVADEPATWQLIDDLHGRGVRILLPALKGRREPDWAWYEGPEALVEGWHGIPEPSGPALGASELGEAEVIRASALLLTPHGVRLGVGGGWYDRALQHADAAARIGVIVSEDEVVPHLPEDPWDHRVHLIATEERLIAVTR